MGGRGNNRKKKRSESWSESSSKSVSKQLDDYLKSGQFLERIRSIAKEDYEERWSRAIVEIEQNRVRIMNLEKEIEQQRKEIEFLKLGKDGGGDADAKERSRSLVLLNLEEHIGSSQFEAQNYDAFEVSKVLKFLDSSAQPVAIYRLGKKTQARPRLIKIVMPNSYAQKELLRKSKWLKNYQTGGRPQLFLRASMTFEERKKDYEIRMARKTTALNSNHAPLHSPSVSMSSPPILSPIPSNSRLSAPPPSTISNVGHSINSAVKPISSQNRFIPLPNHHPTSNYRSQNVPSLPPHQKN